MDKLSPEKKEILAGDPVRYLVFAQTVKLGKPLKRLSIALGCNEAYLHQYIWRGSPIDLPEHVRANLAAMLGVPEEALVTSRVRDRVIARSAASRPNWAAMEVNAEHVKVSDIKARTERIPLYNCPGRMVAADKADSVERPGDYAGNGTAFAVWVEEAIGRLQPGDLAFVRPNQPASPGDSVVITQQDSLVSIGELVERDVRSAKVRTAHGEESYSLIKNNVLKITALACR